MRAPHVVIGCWDDWGVWEVSSSIYLYSLSVHHARIVQQRVPTPNWMSLSLSLSLGLVELDYGCKANSSSSSSKTDDETNSQIPVKP